MSLQEGEEHQYRKIDYFYCKENHTTRDEEKFNEYKKLHIMNKFVKTNVMSTKQGAF